MNRNIFQKWLFTILGILFSGCATVSSTKTDTNNPTIYVAVIGGLMRSGLWENLTKQFEASSGYKLELVLSGNRDLVAESFAAGEIDLAVIHGGDVASNLVSKGFARTMWPWTQNDFVIIGPAADPAKIRGLHDGGEALRRIARAQALFVDYQNSGPRDVAAALWNKAGVRPSGPWLLQTPSRSSEEAIDFARANRAYLILGRVPTIPAGLEILVQDDPIMQRPFVVIEANKRRFPETNGKGIRALAKFLQSEKTQEFLRQFAANSPPGMPLFFPVKSK